MQNIGPLSVKGFEFQHQDVFLSLILDAREGEEDASSSDLANLWRLYQIVSDGLLERSSQDAMLPLYENRKEEEIMSLPRQENDELEEAIEILEKVEEALDIQGKRKKAILNEEDGEENEKEEDKEEEQDIQEENEKEQECHKTDAAEAGTPEEMPDDEPFKAKRQRRRRRVCKAQNNSDEYSPTKPRSPSKRGNKAKRAGRARSDDGLYVERAGRGARHVGPQTAEAPRRSGRSRFVSLRQEEEPARRAKRPRTPEKETQRKKSRLIVPKT